MVRSEFKPWLHRFAVLTALATLWLLTAGGLVTSHGVGMAVPDWPNTYGYNMFLFPPSKWVGGIFYEHTHRLIASGVGLLTTILAVWLWVAETRRWLRWLGVVSFFAVLLQGVLGGLRVVLFKDEIGIFHAALAQLFFALICSITLFTSRWWMSRQVQPVIASASPVEGEDRQLSMLRRLFLIITALVFLQLALGATMRHQHAGLAIPDFPLAYGKLWPATDADSIHAYNARRLEVTAQNSITATQIYLQMAHRLMAVVILVGVGLVAWKARSHTLVLRRLAYAWLGLVLIQATLGAWTIWSNKAADVATAHVLVGALLLVTGVIGSIICFRRFARVTEAQGAPLPGVPCTQPPSVATNA